MPRVCMGSRLDCSEVLFYQTIQAERRCGMNEKASHKPIIHTVFDDLACRYRRAVEEIGGTWTPLSTSSSCPIAATILHEDRRYLFSVLVSLTEEEEGGAK